MSSSVFKEAFAPLRLMVQDRLALTGLIVLGLIFCLAIFAPLIAPQDPFAINEDEDGSVLMRSGSDWVLQPSLGDGALNDTASRGGEDLIAGREGSLWQRVSGTWVRLDTGTESDLFGVDFSPRGAAFAVGDAGTVLLRADEGGAFEALPAPVGTVLRSVAFLDERPAR